MWIELHDTFLDHRKVKKLSRLLGVSEIQTKGHLITLWLQVLRHAPDGNLVDFDNEDISDYASWEGSCEEFVVALIETGWIDQGEYLEVHDWQDYSGTLKSSERKKKDRERKKGVSEFQGFPRNSMENSVNSALNGTEQNGTEQTGTKKILSSSKSTRPNFSSEIDSIIKFYQAYHSRAKPGAKEKGRIRDRLKDGFTEAELCEAIDGCHKSPFHQGENEQGKKFDSLELILRDSAKVNQFIEINHNPPKAQRKLNAAELREASNHEVLRKAAERILGEKNQDPWALTGHGGGVPSDS